MKKFKKALALSLTLAMGMSMVACGSKSETTTGAAADTSAPQTEAQTEAKTDAPQTEAQTEAQTDAPSGDVVTSKDGKVTLDITGWDDSKKIYAYSWDDDFQKKLNVVFEDNPAIEKYVEYINLGCASEESLEQIDNAINDGSKYPSLIPADIGSAKYWTEDDSKTLDLYSIGFTSDMLSNSYQYAIDYSTFNGQLKAVTWQSTAGSVFYNRAIAKDVFGTDDPAQIQEQLKDWDAFFAAADKLKEKGYKIVNGPKDVYYAIINAHTDAWVNVGADGTETFKPDATITKYIETAKRLAEGDYTNMGGMWGGDWAANMKDGGNVFCYFACPWMIGVFTGNGATNGSWGACVGPQAYYWGGTYVSVGKNTTNPELCFYVLYELTCDADVAVDITNKTGDAMNNKAANDRLVNGGEIASDNAGVAFLGGQNPYGTWADAAAGIQQGAVTYQDKNYEQFISDAADGYIAGTYATVDDALNYVKEQSKTALGIAAE